MASARDWPDGTQDATRQGLLAHPCPAPVGEVVIDDRIPRLLIYHHGTFPPEVPNELIGMVGVASAVPVPPSGSSKYPVCSSSWRAPTPQRSPLRPLGASQVASLQSGGPVKR